MMIMSHVNENKPFIGPGTWLCPHSPEEGLSSFLWTRWVLVRVSVYVS